MLIMAMKLFLSILLTVNIQAITTVSKTEEELQKTGFIQYLILENLINLGEYKGYEGRIQIQKAKDEAINCLNNQAIPNSYCQFIANDFMKCALPLVEKVEKLNIQPISKGMIKASLQSTISLAAYVCGSDGVNVLEILNPCFWRAIELKEPCINTFAIDIQSVTRTNKSLFDVTCQAASTLKDCVTSTVESECPKNITQDSIRNFYKYSIESICNLKENK